MDATMRILTGAKSHLLLFVCLIALQGTWSWVGQRSYIQRRCDSKLFDRKTDNADNTRAEAAAFDGGRRRLLAASGGVLAASLFSIPPASALDETEKKRIAIFERTSPSVVFLDIYTQRRDTFSPNVMEVPLGSGSGFIWDDKGHIVTNYHLVRNSQTAQVAILTNAKDRRKGLPADSVPTGQPYTTSMRPTSVVSDVNSGGDGNYMRSFYKATVVGVDPTKDIAVLKVEAPQSLLRPIAVGTSKGIKVGQQALAIGNPFGLDHTLTVGIISGTGREVRSPIGRPITNVIQTDAAINPGNSGGPLLDSSGKLIGMNTAIYSPSGASAGIGFAIPIDTVKAIVETLIRDGKVVRPVLGISLLESKQARALGISSGALVLEVPLGSPAAKAGMKGTRRLESGLVEVGDIIAKVGDTVITTEADLFQALERYKPGDSVVISVLRATVVNEELQVKTVELTIELGSSADLEKKMEQMLEFMHPVPAPEPAPAQ
jgi:S1-C subfamily serine protease